MTSGAPASVSICVATFRRPVGLERVLRGLDLLVFDRCATPVLEIVVVDNDPDGSARAVVESLAAEVRWPIRYEHEPRRGLSHVRNAAMASARQRSELVAFIDDDEEPTPGWLDELLAVQRELDADVVLGPTLRRFEGAVPTWVERGRFFVEPRYPTGTELEHGGIGNALIHTRVLGENEPPFDERMSLAGGEDTLFFLRLSRSGRKIVWADSAVVHEWIPPSRARAGWILKRIYRTSNTWGLCERVLEPTPTTIALRIAKGGARMAYGAALLPVGLVVGRHMLMRALWYMCWGAGNLTGLLGLRYDEYRVTHGR
jgi:succinoglycan biosynthesis protein ExoM